MIDRYVFSLIDSNPNLLPPWVLITGYAYYIEDRPIVSDRCFDKLCQTLDQWWKEIRHPHKFLIERKSLKAGTLYYLDEYPSIVKGALDHVRHAQGHR